MSRVGVSVTRPAQLSLVHLLLIVVVAIQLAIASEFPERECCDPIYPIPEPTSKAPSAPTPTGRSGECILKQILVSLQCSIIILNGEMQKKRWCKTMR